MWGSEMGGGDSKGLTESRVDRRIFLGEHLRGSEYLIAELARGAQPFEARKTQILDRSLEPNSAGGAAPEKTDEQADERQRYQEENAAKDVFLEFIQLRPVARPKPGSQRRREQHGSEQSQTSPPPRPGLTKGQRFQVFQVKPSVSFFQPDDFDEQEVVVGEPVFDRPIWRPTCSG